VRLKRSDYIAQIGSLLTEYGFSSGSVLSFLTLQELKAIHAYITDVPRVTVIGATMTEEMAVVIVGKTMTFQGDLTLAMRLDSRDNQYSVITESLKKTQARFTSADLKNVSDENALRFTALLYAEQAVFEKFNYHADSKNGNVLSLYRFVEENPTQAYRIMGVAKQRYSLDVGLIRGVLETNTPALETGVL
jgi:hypothetical protein